MHLKNQLAQTIPDCSLNWDPFLTFFAVNNSVSSRDSNSVRKKNLTRRTASGSNNMMKKRTSQRNCNRSDDRRKSNVKNFNSEVAGRTRVNTSMNKVTRPPTNHKVIDITRNDPRDQHNYKSRVSVYQYFIIYLIKFGF
jgi:hypothetical protein